MVRIRCDAGLLRRVVRKIVPSVSCTLPYIPLRSLSPVWPVLNHKRRRSSIVSRRTHAGIHTRSNARTLVHNGAVCTLFNGWVCHRKRNERYESSADGHSRAHPGRDFCFKTFVGPRAAATRSTGGAPSSTNFSTWYYIRFQTLLSLCKRVWRACMAHFRPSPSSSSRARVRPRVRTYA